MKVLVFGGTGTLGLATSRILSCSGASLFLTYFQHPPPAADAQDLAGVCGSISCDVRCSNDVDAAFSQARDTMGGVNGVVYAVGSLRRQSAPIASFSDDYFDELVGTQLRGAAYCCRRAVHVLPNPGSIVFVSSVIASRGYIAHESLLASLKAAMERLVRHAAVELSERGIRLNGVAPGYVRTGEREPGDPASLSRLLGQTPMRRPGTPQDVGHAVAYLISDVSSFVTGEILHVDGGLFL